MSTLGSLILGVTQSDAHAVRNRLLQIDLESLGYDVINLGVCTPLADFVECFQKNPSAIAIVIGTLNGHAVTDLQGLRAAKNAGLVTCPVIVGGNLSVGAEKSGRYIQELHDVGADYVLETVDELFPLLEELAWSHAAARPGVRATS